MNDIQEIKNLIFAYAEQLDLGNLGSVAEIFVKGEIYAPATDSTVKGKENIFVGLLKSALDLDNGPPCLFLSCKPSVLRKRPDTFLIPYDAATEVACVFKPFIMLIYKYSLTIILFICYKGVINDSWLKISDYSTVIVDPKKDSFHP